MSALMIAEEANVAPGTLYLYAAGKEALFDMALRAAFDEPVPEADARPHELSDRSSVIESTWRLVRERARFPRPERAAELPDIDDAGAEFEGVVVEVYDWLARYWRGIRMVEKCAVEWPELSTFFYRELRRGGLSLLERYLAGRGRQGRLRTMPDSADLDRARTRATVLAVLRSAFVP
ncbi:MAG: TetR family transcriptional regulator [Gemmatimonadota bacterium]